MTRINGKLRRSTAATAGGALLLLVAGACSDTGGDGGGSLTIAAFGGAYGEAEAAAFFEPFEEAEGVKVNQLDTEASLAQVALQVENDNVLWDIVELAGPDTIRGCEQGLLEKVELDDAKKSALEENALTECGIAAGTYVEGIAYDPEVVKTPPTWEDFFNFEKYPGKRTVESYIQDGTLEYALLGSGVPKEDLYPLDLERATETLTNASENLVVVDSLAQASQLLTSGNAVMIQTASGRVLPLQEAGLSVAFNAVGQTAPSFFAVPKGAPHAEEAMKFLSYIATCEECSTTMGTKTGYSGPNAKGNEQVTGEAKQYLPSNPKVRELSFPVDLDWWGENAEKAQHAWDAFATG